MVDPITIGVGIAAIGSTLVGAVRRRRRLEEAAREMVPVSPAETRSDIAAPSRAQTAQQAAPQVAPQVAPAKSSSAIAEPKAESKEAHSELVAPAYPGLVGASREVRQTLLDVSRELGIAPEALATVIQSESLWNPTLPSKKEGTPRGGFIQLTLGANLPGFDSVEKIWAVREMNGVDQLRKIVLPYFRRMKLERVRGAKEPALELYKLTFLPGDAGKPDNFPLGEKGSKQLLHPKHKITRDHVYNANPVFHDNGARTTITWNDVRKKVRQTEAVTKGKWVTLSGKVVDAPIDQLKESETKSPTQTYQVPAPTGKPGPTFAEGASCAVAASLRGLLREIDLAWPKRIRVSDGLCGDAAHQLRESDHNTGNALDVTLDAANGPNLDALSDLLLKDSRTKYVIWNHRIASPTVEGGKWRQYPTDAKNKGKVNPHTRHLHLSIHASARDDVRPWKVDAIVSSRPLVTVPDDADKLLLDPVRAWRTGKVDNFQWVPLRIGDYELQVAADCLASSGVRLPVSFANVIEMSKGQDMLPNTKAICDERWKQGEKRIVLRTRPPNNRGPDAILAKEVKEWSAKIGPFSRTLIMGPWKEWVLDDVKTSSNATNYGLWGPNGKPIQTLGHRHTDIHVDDSQMFAPVRRSAMLNGKKIDLLDELAKGCPLGGPLPKWLVEKLR